MQEVTNVIATLGFPIAMCMLACWYVYRQDGMHKEEIDKLSEAVHEQTLSIQKLIDKIDTMIGGNSNGD